MFYVTVNAFSQLCGALQLQLVPKGLRKAKAQTRDSCLPVTLLILHRIKKVLDEAPGKFNNIMLWAACCLSFFAFLQSGEMTVPTVSSFDPSWHLTPKDIAVDSVLHPTHIKVLIKGSKNRSDAPGC